ncbi:MAG: type 12 methyltransferase [bacterium]|nr:MAG: type 12 methyltransferase [bacterium]
MGLREHWESIYGKKSAQGVSWYTPHLAQSLAMVRSANLPADAPIIDVGGGASTLVDDLLDLGYTDLTVLDLSSAAIDAARHRLGARASGVQWLVGDITTIELESARYEFWHDRAVFHFLVEESDRRRYVRAVRHALRPNGHIVVATFAPDGPSQCSGLDVRRYDSAGLTAEFGTEFSRVSSVQEIHVTPWGSEQSFLYCYCRGPGGPAGPRTNQG